MSTKTSDKNSNLTSKSTAMEQETTAVEQILNVVMILLEILWMFVRMFIEVLKSFYVKIVPPEKKSVQGEIVLVTGCGHGIGKELALQYAALGAIVVGWDLNLETCQNTCKEIKERGGKAHAYQCDVTNREQIMNLAEKVQKEVGEVSILVNNAGIMPCHPMLEHSAGEIEKIFGINILAHFWMCQAFLPSMQRRNHGHIVALSSMAGIVGLVNLVPYCASKFAVRGMMEALSEEERQLRPDSQIKFTVIYPYMVDTGLCKNPVVRFASLLKMLQPPQVAKMIISAQRMDIEELALPPYMYYMNNIIRMYPNNVGRIFKNFMRSYVDTDKK